MRSLLLILVLANLLFLAVQFDLFGNLVHEPRETGRLAEQVSAERLRIVREPPARPRPPPASN